MPRRRFVMMLMVVVVVVVATKAAQLKSACSGVTADGKLEIGGKLYDDAVAVSCSGTAAAVANAKRP